MELLRLSRLISLCIFLSFYCIAEAGWLNDLVNTVIPTINSPTYYFGDEANPGINGGKSRATKYSEALPPYNRKAGRGSGHDKNCLYQYDINSYQTFDQYTCAEGIDSTSSKNYKIKLRNVVCAGGCWYEHFELDALKAECKIFSTNIPAKSKRVCARIAYPSSGNQSADSGYMQDTYTNSAGNNILDDNGQIQKRGQYLDQYGVTQWDDLYTDQDGGTYPILRPKFCAYDDPWVLDLWTAGGAISNISSGDPATLSKFVDIFDLNPLSQPFQGGSGITSPIANILIELLTFYKASSLLIPSIGEVIVTAITKSQGGNTEVLDTIFKIVNYMLTIGPSVTLDILKQLNEVNSIVGSSYGCVNIPLGDYPPNYCAQSASQPNLSIQAICSTNSSGQLLQNCYGLVSSQTTKADGTASYLLCSPTLCVQSAKDNNFLYNSVRASYTQPIQLCNSSITQNCVNVSSTITRSTAMAANNMVSGTFLQLIKAGNVSIDPTKQYRILYNVLSSTQSEVDIIEISNYSYVDLPDCGKSINGYSSPSGPVALSTAFCQSIWGVDIGDYSDSFNIPITAQSVAPTAPISTASSPITLSYVDLFKTQPTSNSFYAQIDQDTEEYNNICLYQQSNSLQIDCVPRPDVPDVSITTCTKNVSTHMSPCANLSWNVTGKTGTNYSTNIEMVNPQFPSNWSTAPSQPQVYLGGLKFTNHVVDSSNNTIPYQPSSSKDTHLVQSSTLTLYNSMWGNYLNSIMPSESCFQDTCALYLNGLEYIGGSYLRGGAYMCVDKPGCQDDPTQCILTKNFSTTDVVGKAYTWPSIKPSDRVNPNVTSASLTSSQYYVSDGTDIPSTQSIRDKIGLENQSSCIAVPPATCSASTDSATYTATWPGNSTTGNLITGSCLSGYTPKNSYYMSRYCLLQSTGQTVWDTANLANTFYGCSLGCIDNITTSITSTSSQFTQTVTSASDGTAAGTILIKSSQAENYGAKVGTSSTILDSTLNVNFTIANDFVKADIYFTDLWFNDYITIKVNGVTISDSSFGTTLSSPPDIGWSNYKTLDSSLSSLNNSLLNQLKVGSNTIQVSFKAAYTGGIYMALGYNKLCNSPCSAVTTASSTTGYATWTKAAVGSISQGTCMTGYKSIDSTQMTRGCTIVNNASILDTIVNNISSNTNPVASFKGCAALVCSSEVAGNASWPSAGYGSSSTGTCSSGYVAVNSSKMSRSCVASGSNAALETLSSSSGIMTSTNFSGCIYGSCQGETAGNASWPAATLNGTSTGTCVTNYVAINSSKMSRSCTNQSGTTKLDTLTTSSPQTSTNFYGCGYGICAAETAGNATWTSARVSGTVGSSISTSSSGTCQSGYDRVNPSVSMSRTCTIQSGAGKLAAISSDTSCAKSCISNVSAGYTSNSATFNVSRESDFDNGLVVIQSQNYYNSQTGVNAGSSDYVQNDLWMKFYVPTEAAKDNAYISFDTLYFDDYIKVWVTDDLSSPTWSTQITDDSDYNRVQGSNKPIWGFAGNTGTGRDYNNLNGGTGGMADLNTRLKSALKVGTNYIKITLMTYGTGGAKVVINFTPC